MATATKPLPNQSTLFGTTPAGAKHRLDDYAALAPRPANSLSAVELLALSKCVKEKDITAARSEIADNSVHNFGFTVYVQGTLTRAGGTPAMASVVPEAMQMVSLRTPEAVTALLKQLKIGPKRLADALTAIGPKPEGVTELLDVFKEMEATLAKQLPPIPARETITPAKSGNITVNANVSRV